MAYVNPYDNDPSQPSGASGGDYSQPTPQPTQTPPASTYGAPTAQPRESLQQSGGYTPPPNAGSWNSYYQQPGTTQNPYSYNQGGYQGNGYYPPQGGYGQPPQAPPSQPYTYGSDYRYQMPGGSVAGTPYAQTGAYTGGLEGFNTEKLNDPTHTTAKYQFARVASRYAPTAEGYAQLMNDPDFKALGMQSLGKGNIRLPSGEVVDIMRGFQSGGQAWQWGVDEPAAAPQQPAYQMPAAQQNWTNQWNGYGDPMMGGYFGYGGYPPQQGAYGHTPGGYPVQDPYAWWQQNYGPPPTQAWEQPSTPTPDIQDWSGYQGGYRQMLPAGAQSYGADIGYAQNYPSYSQGYTPLAGYAPQPAYGQGYTPIPAAFQYLAQGMVPGGYGF